MLNKNFVKSLCVCRDELKNVIRYSLTWNLVCAEKCCFSITCYNLSVTLKPRRNSPPFVTNTCISLKRFNCFLPHHAKKYIAIYFLSCWPLALSSVHASYLAMAQFPRFIRAGRRTMHPSRQVSSYPSFQSTLFLPFLLSIPFTADNVPTRRYRASSRGPIDFNGLNSQWGSPRDFTRLPGASAIML